MRQLLKPARASQAAAAAGAASAAAAEVIAPPPEMNPAAAAFFDVDNTLMRGASIYHFARGLAARNMFTPLDLLKMTWVQVAYRLRGKEDSGHIDAVRQSALAFVADHKVADIVELGEEIYDETMAGRIWQGTRDLAQRHLAAGQRVWLVTATPVELANILVQPARADRCAGHGGRGQGRRLHRRGWSAACCTARPRPRRCARWPRARAWTWPAARPTATRPTTCPCSSWSATRTWSTRTAGCSPRPGSKAGRSTISGPGGGPR